MRCRCAAVIGSNSGNSAPAKICFDLVYSLSPMTETVADNWREIVAAVYRSDSRRVLATLIRLLGDFDVAEEALHDAFRAALEQ